MNLKICLTLSFEIRKKRHSTKVFLFDGFFQFNSTKRHHITTKRLYRIKK